MLGPKPQPTFSDWPKKCCLKVESLFAPPITCVDRGTGSNLITFVFVTFLEWYYSAQHIQSGGIISVKPKTMVIVSINQKF
jgi:hypothetical protein